MEIVEALLRYITVAVASILYFVGFSTPNWVETEGGDFTWGLWAYCDNTTSARKRDCDPIAPGESDGYYEAARVLSCFAFIIYVGSWMMIRLCAEKLEQTDFGIFLYTLTLVLTVSIVAVVGAYYEEDSRWGHLDPELGYSYWVVVAAAILMVIALLSTIFVACKECCDDRKCKRPSCICWKRCQKKKAVSRIAPLVIRRTRITADPPKSPSLSSSSKCSLNESSTRKITSGDTNDTPNNRPKVELILRVPKHKPSRDEINRDSRSPSPSPSPSPPPPPPPPPPRRGPSPPPQPLSTSRCLEEQQRDRRTRPTSAPSPAGPSRMRRVLGDEEQGVVSPRRQKVPELLPPQYDLPAEPGEGYHLPCPPPPAYEEVFSSMEETGPPGVSHPEEV